MKFTALRGALGAALWLTAQGALDRAAARPAHARDAGHTLWRQPIRSGLENQRQDLSSISCTSRSLRRRRPVIRLSS